MADLLWPMQTPAGDDIRYAERDVIGVETDGEPDPRGFNEAGAWLERVEDALTVEHTTSGVHDTLKIPIAVIYLAGTTGLEVGSGSYHDGTTGTSVVSTVTSPSSGLRQITMASALPSTMRIRVTMLANSHTYQLTAGVLESITSTTVFDVRTWLWDDDTQAFGLDETVPVKIEVHGA